MPSAPFAESSATMSDRQAAAPVSTNTVLFALDQSEWTRFFPQGTARLSHHAKPVFSDMTGITPQIWAETIRHHRPRVIVSAWLTPALERGFITAHGGSVEYLCHVAGSVRHLVTKDLISDGLKVSNWGGLVAPIVAEHAVLLILAGLRNLGSWREVLGWSDNLRRDRLSTRCLRGKRVALHGFGAIARELVALLKPFGISISAYSAGVPASFMLKHGVTPVASLEALCADTDVFITCEALTPATNRIITRDVLAQLPRGTVFVNVGRGAVVDEEALLEAARNNGLRIASDVFVNEPLPPSSPFASLPEAIVSPHIGGPTDDAYPFCGDYALANIDQHLAGLLPESLVTPDIYERST